MAAALIALGANQAHALSMGKVLVQSALGQSLLAEIDLADLSDDDAKSLKSTLASPSAFAGMGLEYNPALNGAQIAVQRRPNGNRYLKLTSSRPLNEPFIDIVVELSWSSGRIVRTYTVLLDPPSNQENASGSALAAPMAEPQAVTTTPPGAAASVGQPAPAAVAPIAAAPAPAVNAKSATPNTPATSPVSRSDSDRKRVRVRPGDTAGNIARSMASEGVTVEQMLVAMLSANPSAFVDGNVNRLLADAEILAPDAAMVKKTTQSQARRIIDGQNQEFQSLRRGLASQVPPAPAPTKQTEAVGSASKPAQPSAPIAPKAAPSDTLKLSKDSVQDKADKASMDQIAQQRAKTEASERARELAKNIEELNQLAKVATKPEAAVVPTAPTVSTQGAAGIAAAASAASNPTQSPSPAITSSLPTTLNASADGWVKTALQNLGISGLVLAALGLLAAFGWYRWRQAKPSSVDGINGNGQWKSTASSSFELGGGGRVDTTDIGTAALNSTFYPDSQLEVAQELDPVAEAEVYLAYGKDVPAEEILKEGLQQDPTRVAIHLKLLAIFAKRGDTKSFDAMAREVSTLTQERGPDWAQVQEMGRALDPSNPLYGFSAPPATAAAKVAAPEAAKFEQSMFNVDTETMRALSDSPRAKTVPPIADAPFVETAQIFDLSSIELASPPNTETSRTTQQASTDRLDATLALAEQFLEIGEKEGARALLEEVISAGSEPLRQRATRLLAKAG